jgi:hypothetical protein
MNSVIADLSLIVDVFICLSILANLLIAKTISLLEKFLAY